MGQEFPKAEFTNVDQSADPSYYIGLLDTQHAHPFHQMYKHRTFALLGLGPAMRVLDVGSGTGTDAAEIARLVAPDGEAIGLDRSQIMVEEARRRHQNSGLPLQFVQGDVHQMAFPDNSFDRCRADRTFQHLPDARRAVTEMIRVTKAGGRLLIVEPDHDSVVIDSPHRDITRRFLQFRSDTFQGGGVAHHLYALFKEAGLTEVAVEPLTEVTTDYEAVNRVAHYDGGIRIAARHGAVTVEEAERWIAAVEQAAQRGSFLRCMTYLVTTGRKPE